MKSLLEIELWESKPGRFVLAAASFILGTALAVYELEFFYKLAPFGLLFALSHFGLKKQILLLSGICLFLGILNGELRRPQPANNDISRHAGSFLLIEGELLELRTRKALKPSAQILPHELTVKCKRILPDGEKVSGNLKVICISPSSKFKQRGRAGTDLDWKPSAEESLTSKLQAGRSAAGDSRISELLSPGTEILLQGKVRKLEDINRRKSREFVIECRKKHVFCCIFIKTAKIKLKNRISCKSRTEESAFKMPDIENTCLQVRTNLLAFHKRTLGSRAGQLLSSMILGDRAVSLDESFKSAFRAAGLSHILAASGFNLSIASAAVYFCLRLLTANRWILSASCLLSMTSFVLIAGPSPSILRAFLMGVFLIFSRLLYRKLHMTATLIASGFLLVLADPYSIADLGLQLSYLSTAGLIILLDGQLYAAGDRVNEQLQKLKLLAAASIVAQAAVLPIQLLKFQTFNPYFLPANILVLPVVPFVTVLGFAASFMAFLEATLSVSIGLSTFIDSLTYFPLLYIEKTVAFIATLPFAEIKTETPEIVYVNLYLLMFFGFYSMKKLGRNKVWAVLFLISTLLLFCFPAKSRNDANAKPRIGSSAITQTESHLQKRRNNKNRGTHRRTTMTNIESHGSTAITNTEAHTDALQ